MDPPRILEVLLLTEKFSLGYMINKKLMLQLIDLVYNCSNAKE